MSTVQDRWSGDGSCGFCLQGYVLQLEVYCVECDRPCCPLCALHRAGSTASVCPDCAAAPPLEEV